MRKLSKTVIFLLISIIGLTQPAHADSPMVEWKTPGQGFDSYSQVVQIDNANESLPLFFQVMTKSLNPTLNREELFLLGINYLSPTQFSVQFSLGTTSTKFKVTPGTDCNLVGPESDFHDLMCNTRINDELRGKWKISIVSTDTSDALGTWYKATINNQASGRTYALGEIRSASKSLKFVYLTQRLFTNSPCSQIPKSSYLFRVPTDNSGAWFQLIRGGYDPCENVSWVIPSSDARTIPDGIKVQTGEKSPGAVFYSSSIDEILYPDAWESARRFFQEKSDRESNSAQMSRDSLNFAEIERQKETISKLRKEILSLKSSIQSSQNKLQNICKSKPRPKGC